MVVVLWISTGTLWVIFSLSCCALRCCCTEGTRRISGLLALALSALSVLATLLASEQLVGAFDATRLRVDPRHAATWKPVVVAAAARGGGGGGL